MKIPPWKDKISINGVGSVISSISTPVKKQQQQTVKSAKSAKLLDDDDEQPIVI